jgi:hypothetical protein
MTSVPLAANGSMMPFAGQSDRLVSALLKSRAVRQHYLKNPHDLPTIVASPFIPPSIIEHLMRNKKDSALGVKYLAGDAISNMEGAAHTFVTSIMRARMHGDYAYKMSHTVLRFPLSHEGDQQAREVVVSASIQPDFEDSQIMLALARLGPQAVEGADWKDWAPVGAAELAKPSVRAQYDARLRAHLIHHLVRRLPALNEVEPLSVSQAIAHLESGRPVQGVYVELGAGKVLSLELLWRTSVEAQANEFGALEALCPLGYVYTFDPPSIFARMANATLLNRIQASALAHLVAANPGGFTHMRIFAFNDYADAGALAVFARSLAGTGVRVIPKADLFPPESDGRYSPPPEGAGALLVIHNNSDAFGQNIETEGPNSSMDGAIGCASSTAGSLRRDMPGLTSQVLASGVRLRT